MTSNEFTPHRRTTYQHSWQTLIEFDLPREPDSDRLAVDRVAEALQRLDWSDAPLRQLKLAVSKATRGALERSHLEGSGVPLVIRVLIPEDDPATRGADEAGREPTEKQVAGRQVQQVGRPPSRGWGFFLIERPAPDSGGDRWNLLELFLYPGGK